VYTSKAFCDSRSIQAIAWSDVVLHDSTTCSNRPSTGIAVLTSGGNLPHLQNFLSTIWYIRPGAYNLLGSLNFRLSCLNVSLKQMRNSKQGKQNIDPKMYSSGVGVLGKKSSWKRHVKLGKDFRWDWNAINTRDGKD